MLRDRYDPVDVFQMVPQLSHAIEPVIAQLDTLLDDDCIFQQVKADLSQRYPHTLTTGRPSTPVEVILRLLIIKHLYGWSYAQTEQWVADSLVLRDFCRIYWQPVPDDTTLMRWANLIQPATLHQLLDHVVAVACQLRVTRGRKLRTDGTVVETNIHQPTDSSLLSDGVRVISRILKSAQSCAWARPATPHSSCFVTAPARPNGSISRSSTRYAVAVSRPSNYAKPRYERLVAIGDAVIAQAQAGRRVVGGQQPAPSGQTE